MKWKHSFLIITVFVGMLLSACASDAFFGSGKDWDFRLPNRYILAEVNGMVVYAHDFGATFSAIIDGDVAAFCYNKRYVGLKVERTKGEFEYYLSDTKEMRLYGPFENLRAYETARKRSKTGYLGAWFDITEKAPTSPIWIQDKVFLMRSVSPKMQYVLDVYRTCSDEKKVPSIQVYLQDGGWIRCIYDGYHESDALIVWLNDHCVSINGESLNLAQGDTYDWKEPKWWREAKRVVKHIVNVLNDGETVVQYIGRTVNEHE